MKIVPLVTLLRPHQWVKNVFVLAPLFFTPRSVTVQSTTHVLLGVVCFCLLSSAVYILNDYGDRKADRTHPEKKHRPLAARTVSKTQALVLLFVLLCSGLYGAFLFSPAFCGITAAYFVLNLAYTFWLKNVSIVEVMCIALGFVLRVEGGAQLIDVEPSVWILVCTGLLALFLAIAKRRDDIIRKLKSEHRRSLDGYTRYYLDVSLTMVLGSLVVSYLIYTTDQTVMERMGSDKLYTTTPFVLAGILRYLQITLVEEASGSPTKIVLTDKFLIVTILGWLAAFGALMYL